MCSLFNRGTKARPRWVMQFKQEGRFVQRPSKFKLEREAEDELEDIESRIRRGEAGWVDLDSGKTCGDLFSAGSDALSNRNADDDRGRLSRYLAPAWKHARLAAVKTERVMRWIDAMRAGTAPAVYTSKKKRARRSSRAHRCEATSTCCPASSRGASSAGTRSSTSCVRCRPASALGRPARPTRRGWTISPSCDASSRT